jgi:hypothetical protein
MDLDASLFEQFSKLKEGSKMSYKGEVGYYPLFAYWAEEKEMLGCHLQRGNAGAAKKSEYFLLEVLKNVPVGKKLYLRADSEFYEWSFILLCEEKAITYAITADLSPQLKEKIEALPESSWKRYQEGIQMTELSYAPSGQSAHRYVVKRKLQQTKKGEWIYIYHAVVTNDLRKSAKQVLRWYYKRCTMENFIKEQKHDFGLERFPTRKFHANWMWLLIGQLSWNIVAWFKKSCLPEECHTQTVKTLRHRIFHLAGKIVRKSRQKFLVISEEYKFQDIWAFAINKLANFNPNAP